MKFKKLLVFLMPLFFSFPFLVSAAANLTYTPMEKLPGFASTDNFYTYIANIYKLGIWVVGIAAMLMIIIGGYMYLVSAGNNASMEKAKEVIKDAIIGLILALTSYLLLYTINPDLVKIKVLGTGETTTGVTTTLAPGVTTTLGPGVTTTQGPGGKGPNCNFPVPKSNEKVCAGATCSKKCDTSPYDVSIKKYASQNNVPEKIIRAIICRESFGDPNASRSDTHATGLMQVVPGSNSGTCGSNLSDPDTNICEGTKLLRKKYDAAQKYSYSVVKSTWEMVFAAYNCCANGENPNALSNDCKDPAVPRWACPIKPGSGKFNMCDVKDYACDVAACAGI